MCIDLNFYVFVQVLEPNLCLDPFCPISVEVVECWKSWKKGRRKRQGESRYIDRWTRARYGVVLRIQSEEKGGEKSGGWKLLAMARYMGDPLRE